MASPYPAFIKLINYKLLAIKLTVALYETIKPKYLLLSIRKESTESLQDNVEVKVFNIKPLETYLK